MSLRMVKMCDESLVKLLFNIFQFSLETGNFPSYWKRSIIVPVHKKGNKDLINKLSASVSSPNCQQNS